MKNDRIFAYKFIDLDLSEQFGVVQRKLDKLIEVSNLVDSKFLLWIKPIAALQIKWKFDYLAKTLASPFELNKDLDY